MNYLEQKNGIDIDLKDEKIKDEREWSFTREDDIIIEQELL